MINAFLLKSIIQVFSIYSIKINALNSGIMHLDQLKQMMFNSKPYLQEIYQLNASSDLFT